MVGISLPERLVEVEQAQNLCQECAVLRSACKMETL